MEYIDYETNLPISREQYIANGLERGELLLKEDCGCMVIQDRTSDAYIVYCPLHAQTPRLYEVLLAVRGVLNLVHDELLDKTILDRLEMVNKAIAEVGKAQG